MSWFRNLKQKFKNLWYWLPIIWKDRDYDSYFITYILQKKLEKHRRWLKCSYSMKYEGIEKDIKKIRLCELLLKRINEDKYDSMLDRELKLTYNEEHGIEIIIVEKGITIGLCSNPLKYEDYLKYQDLNYLFKILNKNLFSWWD